MLGSLFALLIFAAPAPSGEAEAAQLRADRANALWTDRKLEEAERELQAAYSINPIPKYLYGLGMIAKDRGDCTRAVGYFERFLEALPDTVLTDESKRGEIEAQARDAIAACEGPPPDPVAPTPPARAATDEPEPVGETTTPPPRASLDSDLARPWHRDPVGAALLGVGAVAAVTGSTLLISASVTDRRLSESDSATDFLSDRDRARSLGTAGIVTMSVGGALLAGAIIRYVVVGRRGAGRSAFRLSPGIRHSTATLRF